MEKEFSIEMMNSSDNDKNIIIEPWAEEFLLRGRQSYTINIHSDQDGVPLISVNDDQISVYLWSGCTCDVIIDGRSVLDGMMRTPSP
ncbi:hypothetical protein RCO27_13570 [Sphingosinicella sp. LHD-64]|uniref:hypothetical protein n=1 Tax=Sphingosinicella sp. LHD-64 TaxID=3072139 RepID=UPI0028107E6D|nr:hypothetical protein [Sphingosinicella sp. LHD-64]MDQ8757255.1 hypothetical protein [Sphingosinicella sp. LHD-64]